MYIGVDVGGSKTLLAVLDGHGVILESTKFPTPKNYDHFLLEVRHALAHFTNHDFKAGGAGIPAINLDRARGRGISFGNLPWRNVPAQQDLEHIFKCPIVVENDAKLAGLSESMLIKEVYSKVLYVTVSTGIGYALIVNQTIDASLGDGGGRLLLAEHQGKLMPWEDFASGRAIVERYGKRASEIEDSTTWRRICRDLAKGLIELIATTEPEVIVFGGSVGNYFGRFGELLDQELRRYHLPLLTRPALRGAQRPEEAVVYGCYDLAKQTFNHDHAAATR